MQPKRSGAITAFGVIHIVFAGLGVLGMIISLALESFGAMEGNPVEEVLASHSVLAAWQTTQELLGIPRTLLLLIGGIGLLQMRGWARTASIVYGAIAVVDFAAALVIIPGVLYPALEEAVGGAMAGAQVSMTALGLVIGSAYAFVVLAYMTRPRVKEAFAAAAHPVEATADVFR